MSTHEIARWFEIEYRTLTGGRAWVRTMDYDPQIALCRVAKTMADYAEWVSCVTLGEAAHEFDLTTGPQVV